MDGTIEFDEIPLVGTRLDEAVAVATAAFEDDPFSVHLFPRRRHRHRATAQLQRDSLGRAGSGALVRTASIDGHVKGVAQWFPPGSWPPPGRTATRQRLFVLRVHFPHLARLASARPTFQAAEAAHPSSPHWYLHLVTVSPALQGRGIGTSLLRPTLDRCDDAGNVAWLETQMEENLSFYERLGFVVDQVLEPTEGMPPLWTMRRDPRPPS